MKRKLFTIILVIFYVLAAWSSDDLTIYQEVSNGKIYYYVINEKTNYGYMDLTFTILDEDEKTCELTKVTYFYDEKYNYILEIPSTACNYKVIGIGSVAFTDIYYNIYTYAPSSADLSIILPNTLKYIGENAFAGFRRLKSVTMPSGLKRIGESAFVSSGIKAAIIPDNVNSIGPKAFGNCVNLSTVHLPESAKSIPDYCFSGCTGLTSIIIPNSVTNIGNGAFSGCGMTSINIPNGVTNIGGQAFYGSALTSITIPNSVTSIGGDAFHGCCDLASVIIENGLKSIEYGSFMDCHSLTSIIIPQSVTSIGLQAFFCCTGLTSVTIENGVKIIESDAFAECTGLTSITIPESVESIYGSPFYRCSNLSSIKVEEGNIKYDSREDCNAIIETATNTLVVGCNNTIIPNSVTGIGGRAFDGCSTLTSVTIPDNVTIIGEMAFSGCSGLISINLPDVMTDIGNCAFLGCSSLPSVIIPNGIKQIGYDTFNSCSNLTSITIPSSVTSIWGSAFGYCDSLADVYCYAKELPYTESNLFAGSNIGDATLHVPETSLEAYSTTEPWSSFGSIVALPSPTYTLTYIVDGETYKTVQYEEGESIIPEAEPTKEGYTFSGWSEIPETMPARDVTVIGSFIVNLATGIVLDKEALLFNSVEPQQLHVTLTPENLINKTFAWSSSNKEIASVDGNGMVTPVNNGEAVITVSTTDGSNLEASCMVLVDFKAATLTIDKENVTFKKLKSKKLTAIITPEGASQEVTWSSSDESIVTVSETGTIKPRRNGEAVITAVTTDGTQLEATCEVTVNIPSQFEAEVTQTTLSIGTKDGMDEATNVILIIDGEEYNGATVTGLAPNRTYHVKATADIGKYNWTEELDVTTADIAVNFDCTASPTTLDITASYDAGDATVTYASFSSEVEVNTLNLTGLEPAQSYEYTYYITTEEGGTATYKAQFATEALNLKISQTKVVAVGDVVVVANSNIAEEENVSVGFEWRRYDWPDEIENRSGAAYIYEGIIEGSIKNLNADKFWRIRPFFQSQAGSRYWGDWVTIDPSDASYFEPSVHTYNTINVEDNTAEVKGFVMQGSDDVVQQGFMYWTASPQASSRWNASGVPSDAKVVEANGNMMVASLKELEYETEYSYVAFVRTSGGTFYGEKQTFTTGEMDPDGIEEVYSSESIVHSSEEAVYDLSGRQIVNSKSSNSKLPRGINIIRMSDGTTRKVLVK